MERRKALGLAAAIAVATGGVIVAGAALTQTSFLGFGSSSHTLSAALTPTALPATAKRRIVTRDVYDRRVIALPEVPVRTNSAPTIVAPLTAPTMTAPDTLAPPVVPPSAPATTPVPRREPDDDVSAPTTEPATPSTPDLEISDDWPADKPLPPIPANCQQPHLEDNGVWNCEGSDD